MAENNTVEDLKAPLLAAVGAADLALATVNEILTTLRERAELAGDRMDDRRAALTRLQEELPKKTEELRGKLLEQGLTPEGQRVLERALRSFDVPVVRAARIELGRVVQHLRVQVAHALLAIDVPVHDLIARERALGLREDGVV